MSIKYANEKQIEKGEVTPVVSLRDYFSEEHSMVIPPWQREYTWRSGELSGEGEVYRLLTDLQAFAESDAEQYLLGVVTLANIKNSQFGSRAIVDGQQRTVTLLIMFMCCLEFIRRDKVVDFGHTEIISDLKRMVGIDNESTSQMRVTFAQDDANKILQKFYTWAVSPIEDLKEKNAILKIENTYSETQVNLLETREYISERLEDPDSQTGFCVGKLIESLKKILTSVRVIQLTLDSEEEALEIYNRMNDRGVRLNSADLIKNQLFMSTEPEEFGQISEEWNSMTKFLNSQDNGKIKDPVFLVRSHASMFWGKTIKESSLASQYERNYFPHKEALTPLGFTKELKRLADEGSTVYGGSEVESLFASQYLGVVQHFPLILAGTYIQNKEAKVYFFNQIGTRAALAALSKEFPPQLESIFPTWANEVYSARESLTVSDLKSLYKELAFKSTRTGGSSEKYEADRRASLLEQIDEWKFGTGSQKRKIRASLALMSWWTDRACKAENEWTVSHYFNSKGKTAWDVDHVGATAWQESSDEILDKDSIGNLVLLEGRSNKKAQAKSPEKKKEEYRDCSIILTKRLLLDPLAPKHNEPLIKIEKQCGISDYEWKLEDWSVDSLNSHQNYYKGLLSGILFRKVEL